MISEPATKGDIIAITALISSSFAGLILSPIAYSRVDSFEKMFKSLKAELPGITKLVLQYGDILGFVIAPLIAIGAWAIYLKVDDMTAKVSTTIASALINWAILYVVFAGIFSPILEIQKQLS